MNNHERLESKIAANAAPSLEERVETLEAGGGNAATATVLQTARTINGVSFNGSANIETGWSLARKPASPHADNEEFEGTPGTIPVAWTQGGSVQATAIDPYANFNTATQWRHSTNSRRPSWLMMQPTADATQIFAIHKPVTVGTNKAVMTRLSWNSRYASTVTANDSSIGIMFCASTAGAPDVGNCVQFFIQETNTNEWAVKSAAAGGGTAGGKHVITNVQDGHSGFQYLLMQKISTAVHFWIAAEGGRWIYLPTCALTYSGATMDRFGVIIMNSMTSAPGNQVLGADFFRFSDAADFMP